MDQKGTGQGTTDTKTGQGEKKERGKEMEDERRFISEKREKKKRKKRGSRKTQKDWPQRSKLQAPKSNNLLGTGRQHKLW